MRRTENHPPPIEAEGRANRGEPWTGAALPDHGQRKGERTATQTWLGQHSPRSGDRHGEAVGGRRTVRLPYPDDAHRRQKQP